MSLIFLTGSTGFIGSHLLTKLQSLGHEVVTDMRYLHTRKYDCLVHLASKNNIKNEFDSDLIESNIILTKEIFKVPTRIIYASSCVAKYPLNPYAYSKLYAEHLGAIHGNAIGLRFHNCYGPGNNKGIVQHLLNLSDGEKLNVRGPDQLRDYINIDSVVSAICKAYTWMPGVHDVGTGVATSTMDLVNLFQKISGRQFDISVSEPGDNEPPSMVSEKIVPHISLEQGLLKMINAD